MIEHVILVDEKDQPQGQGEKLETHQKALLHRAFSIFLFNGQGETLIQERFHGKYHSGGLWANTCCGHPRPGEETIKAAERRLGEELGIQAPLTPGFQFLYKASLDQGLTEHEFVHAFHGFFEGAFTPNPEEVQKTRWISLEALQESMTQSPERYAAWFKLYVEQKWPSLLAMRGCYAP